MSFLLYMSSQEIAYNILQSQIEPTIDISNTVDIGLDGTGLVSTFIGGTTITPHEFVNKITYDLQVSNYLTLGEDSYASVERIKELHPKLQLFNTSSNANINTTLSNIDTSLNNISNTELTNLNSELDTIIAYFLTQGYKEQEPEQESEPGWQPQTTNELQTAVYLWTSNKPSALAAYGEINTWDTSLITDMNRLFKDKSTFNDDISNWDVSNVTNFQNMFMFAEAFNQPLNSWNVSNAINMSGMFVFAYAFNQPLNSWNVSNATNMSGMFQQTTSFNQPLNSWNVSNVTTMDQMFLYSSFNQDITQWDVSSVTSMKNMFQGNQQFNNDIRVWNVGAASFENMFLNH